MTIKNLGLKPRRSRTALSGKILVVTDPPRRSTVYTQVESELVAIRAEWTQTVAARVLK